MPLVTPNSQDSPTFQAQAVVDKTDLAALANIAQNYGVVSGCLVSPGGGYTINVASGSIQIGSTQVAVAAVTGLSLIAASPTDRRDIVVSSNVGAVSIVSGTPTAETIIPWAATSLFDPPIKPAIPSNSVLLGEIYIPGGGGTIVASWLTDKTLITIGSAVYLTRHYDGTTDDAGSINTQLATLAASGGGTAWLPAGKNPCMISTDILIPASIRLLGFGPFKQKNPGGAIPSYTGNGWLGTCIAPLAGATFTLGMVVLNGNSAQVDQIEVVPGTTAPVGIYVNNVGCRISNSFVWGGTTAGIDTASGNGSQDVTIFNTTCNNSVNPLSSFGQAYTVTGGNGTTTLTGATLPPSPVAPFANSYTANGVTIVAYVMGCGLTRPAPVTSIAGTTITLLNNWGDTLTTGTATVYPVPDANALTLRVTGADAMMIGNRCLLGSVVITGSDCQNIGCHYSAGETNYGSYNVVVNTSGPTMFSGCTLDCGNTSYHGGIVRRDLGLTTISGCTFINGSGNLINGTPAAWYALTDNEPAPSGGFVVAGSILGKNAALPGCAGFLNHLQGANPNNTVNGLGIANHMIATQGEVTYSATFTNGSAVIVPTSMTGITVGATIYAVSGTPGIPASTTVSQINTPSAGQVTLNHNLTGATGTASFAFEPNPTLANLYNGGNPGVSRSVVYGGTLQAELPVSGGTGTVTSASVVSANGLAGTVATPTTTPAITLSTSVTGLLKGNGAAISAAVSGTDYALGTEPIAAAETTRATAAEATKVTGGADVTTGGTVQKVQGVAVTAAHAALLAQLNNATTRNTSTLPATALAGEETVLTGSTAAGTLTLPASTAQNSTINTVLNLSSVSVTLAAGAGTTLNSGGTVGSIAVPVNGVYQAVLIGTVWYVIDSNVQGGDVTGLTGAAVLSASAPALTAAVATETTRATAAEALLAPKASPTFTGTVTVPSGAVLGTPTSVTLTNATGLPETGVTNLTSDLALKAPLASPTFTGTVGGITAAMVGADASGLAATETTRATAAEGTLTTNVATNTTAIATKVTSLARATVVTSTPGAPVAANALIPVDTTSGTVNIPLPVAPADKTLMAIKHVTQGGTNSVTFSCGGSDVFNVTGGVTSKSLPLLNQSALLEYTATGAIWTVISDALTLASLDLRYLGIATVIPESQVTNLVTDLARVQRTRRLFTNINF